MRKITFYFLTAIFICFALVGSVNAAVDIGSGLAQDIAGQSGYNVATDEYSLSQTIGSIIRTALGLIGTIFLVLIVYAGFLWMTAGGGEDNIKKAKNIIQSSVIGLVLVLSAYSITYFVMKYAFHATTAPSGTYLE